jgi:hypothetical protein
MKRILWEKIDDYLDGIMDERAAIRFEQELKNDPVLRENFTIMKGLKEMLNIPGLLEFMEIVVQARKNHYKKKQKQINRRRRFNRVCKIWPKKNCN